MIGHPGGDPDSFAGARTSGLRLNRLHSPALRCPLDLREIHRHSGTSLIFSFSMSYTVGQVSIEKAPRSSAPRVRLTCEACRQRKVRCDKLSPCTSCQRLGLVCVPVERARLPRGRTRKPAERVGGTDKELSERVAKLEALLRKVATERDGDADAIVTEASHPSAEVRKVDPNGADHSEIPSPSVPHRPHPSTTYMGISFWEDIIQQVGLSG